jgi:hypothetical protein
VIARAAALTALAMIDAAIGAALGYAALALMAAASWTKRLHQKSPQTAVHGRRYPTDQAPCPAMRAGLLDQASFGKHRRDLENSSSKIRRLGRRVMQHDTEGLVQILGVYLLQN